MHLNWIPPGNVPKDESVVVGGGKEDILCRWMPLQDGHPSLYNGQMFRMVLEQKMQQTNNP